MEKHDLTNKMISLSDIQTVSRHCINLLSRTESLRIINEDAYKKAEELFPLLRKLFIASMMHDKRLICISGLQGAGKTTLMKNFYGIEGDFMNVSLGRGERVPVLITEGRVNEPHIHAIAVRKNGSGEYSKTEIIYQSDETDEIIRATTGEDKTIMYIEIIVPYRHTNDEGVSFMLLPGFEKNNEYWNNLIEFSVNSSDAAVFVFNETSFSNAENEGYLSKIETRFGANVVYAISGSDSSLDDNAQVKNTCMEVLKVKEPDRVICVGQYNDTEKNNAWIADFKAALDKYALFEPQVKQKTASYINNELLKFKDTLYCILRILNGYDEEYEATDYQNHKLLEAYDSVILTQRKKLAKHISEEFEYAKERSKEMVSKQFINESWSKNLKKTFFGTSVKDYIETQKRIKSSLYDENNKCLPDFHLGNAILKSINVLDQPNGKNALQLLLETNEKEDGKTALVESERTKTAIDDVRALIQVPNNNVERSEIHCDDEKRLLKAVAEIATYYYGFTSYNSLAETTTGLVYYEPAKSHITGDDILKGAESSKKFAIGLAGVMGVDILGDGTLNLISQIATSFSVSLPIAGAAAVLIVGTGAATAVLKDINRMQREDFESAKMAIFSIYDNIQQEAMERFDVFTNEVRERIEDNLADLGGGRKNRVSILNAKIEVKKLLDILKDITKEYLKQSHGIGTYF